MPQPVYKRRYKVMSELGAGAFASVYLAQDLQERRLVAVKVLRPEVSRDERHVERFWDELQIVSTLHHPQIVQVLDWGQDGSNHFIVFEYISGVTLAQVLETRRPLSVNQAFTIALGILAGLGHAHFNRIIHRDLAPHNVMINRLGQLKIMDFGIAKTQISNLTYSSPIIGAPHYISPEQALGQTMDVRSDLYSAGVILYEMLAGRPPFEADSDMAVALKHTTTVPLALTELNSTVSPEVDSIVQRVLTKEPAQRYQNAAEMAFALSSYLERKGGAVSLRDLGNLTPHGQSNLKNYKPVPPPVELASTAVPVSPLPNQPTTSPKAFRPTSPAFVAARPGKELDEPKRRTGLWLLLGLAIGAPLCILLLALILIVVINSNSKPVATPTSLALVLTPTLPPPPTPLPTVTVPVIATVTPLLVVAITPPTIRPTETAATSPTAAPVVVPPTLASPSVLPTPTPDDLFNKANDSAAVGNWNEAIPVYKQILSQFPSYKTDEVKNRLALSNTKLSLFKEALDLYRDLLRKFPTYNLPNYNPDDFRRDLAEAYCGYGLGIAKKAEVDEVVANLGECVRLNPEYPNATGQLAAELLYKEGRDAGRIKNWPLAIEKLGSLYVLDKQYRADAGFPAAILFDAYMQYVLQLTSQSEFNAARQQCNEVARMDIGKDPARLLQVCNAIPTPTAIATATPLKPTATPEPADTPEPATSTPVPPTPTPMPTPRPACSNIAPYSSGGTTSDAPDQGKGNITGNVLDKNGRGISGAVIQANSGGFVFTAVTGGNGSYQFGARLGKGIWTVVVLSAPGINICSSFSVTIAVDGQSGSIATAAFVETQA